MRDDVGIGPYENIAAVSVGRPLAAAMQTGKFGGPSRTPGPAEYFAVYSVCVFAVHHWGMYSGLQ